MLERGLDRNKIAIAVERLVEFRANDRTLGHRSILICFWEHLQSRIVFLSDEMRKRVLQQLPAKVEIFVKERMKRA